MNEILTKGLKSKRSIN